MCLLQRRLNPLFLSPVTLALESGACAEARCFFFNGLLHIHVVFPVSVTLGYRKSETLKNIQMILRLSRIFTQQLAHCSRCTAQPLAPGSMFSIWEDGGTHQQWPGTAGGLGGLLSAQECREAQHLAPVSPRGPCCWRRGAGRRSCVLTSVWSGCPLLIFRCL